MPIGILLHSLAHARVGRDAATYGNGFDARVGNCFRELVHEYLDDGFLESRCQVGLVFFNKIGVKLQLVAQRVEKRSLEPAEAVVVAIDMRMCKLEMIGIALVSQPVDNRAAWIR